MTHAHQSTAAARWLVAGSFVLCACASAPSAHERERMDQFGNSGDLVNVEPEPEKPGPAPVGQGRGPTAREARVVSELMGAAERVRGLRFERQVPLVIEDRQRITAYVESQIEDEELMRERTVYIALGLLAPELDVRALLLRVMGEQVVGYYDPEAGRLVVRDDVMEAFTRASQDEEQSDLVEARTVLVHELVHALQDQKLGLSKRVKEERSTDAENAFHALVEGDATLAMYAYALEREQIPLHRVTGNPAMVRSFSDAVRHSPLTGSELEQAPPIVRVPLLSAYVDGLSFCASLHGARGWSAIDGAHQQSPASTEQVLHPERFALRDDPETVTLPKLPSVEASGYREVQEDTLGELELRVYFAQVGAENEADRAADGWDGDRLRVYQKNGGDTAVVWMTVWDSERDAEEAARAAQRVLDAALPATRERGDVVRRDKSVLIVRDLPSDARRAVRAAFSGTDLAAR